MPDYDDYSDLLKPYNFEGGADKNEITEVSRIETL